MLELRLCEKFKLKILSAVSKRNGITPLIWSHVNPYRTFRLNLDERLGYQFRSKWLPNFDCEMLVGRGFRARIPLVTVSPDLPNNVEYY